MLSLSPNAEAVANNYDLLTQILFRLPVISLLRFKSVSKGWCSLISDPAFSRRVLPDKVSGLILQSNRVEFASLPLRDKSFNKAPSFNCLHSFGIVQSCHGLLLCARIREIFSYFPEVYGIYNPTIEEFVELPPPGNYQHQISGFSLAFDPTKSPHYKVVFVSTLDPNVDFMWDEDLTSFQIEIYSSQSQTHSWRLSGNPFIADVHMPFSGGVFWNGAIYWMSRDASLYFNVEEEKLDKMLMPWIPEGLEEKSRIVYFGESGDHLHLINQPYVKQFDIYEMERDYSGWFVKYRVDLDEMTVSFPDMILSDSNGYLYVTFGVVREEDDEDSYIVLHVPGKVVQYNFKDCSFKTICEVGPNDDNNDDDGFPLYDQPSLKYNVAYQFIPSLSSI